MKRHIDFSMTGSKQRRVEGWRDLFTLSRGGGKGMREGVTHALGTGIS